MDKKRLFLISPMLHQGGFERVCVTTARLLENEYDVSIIIFSDADIAFDIKGLNIINLDVPAKDGALNKVINVFKRIIKLKKVKKEYRPSVSYSFGPTANLINVLTKVKGINVWAGIRSYMDMDMPKLLRLFTQRADKVICCSKQIASEIKEVYHCDKVETLYNLYDVNKIKKEAEGEILNWPFGDDKRHTIIAMGRDDDVKGYWHMIKAFKGAHDICREARLVILGDGNFDDYKKLVKDLKIENEVFFAGMRTDPYKYLKRSGIYAMTSYNEGFPNSLVEGMALGLACISTNCKTGPAEILISDNDISVSKADTLIDKAENGIYKADYGLLIKRMSKEKDLSLEIKDELTPLTKAFIMLLTNDEIYEKYSNASIMRASEFSYEAYKKKIIDYIENK